MKIMKMLISLLVFSVVLTGCSSRAEENLVYDYFDENNSVFPEIPTSESSVFAEPHPLIEEINALIWSDPVFKRLILETLSWLDNSYDGEYQLHVMFPDGLASVTHLTFDAMQPWMYEPGFDHPVVIQVWLNEYWVDVQTCEDFFQSSFVETIDDIVHFPNLQNLGLLQIEVRCIEPVTKLPNLERLRLLALANLIDISPIARVPGLKSLTFSESVNDVENIIDYIPLFNLTNLETLHLSNVNIQNYSFLTDFHNLREMSLFLVEIEDIGFISKLQNLERLSLTNNSIVDISPISNLANLAYLNLSNNLIYNIEPLADLVNLSELDISRNNITDISALENLTNLTLLNFDSHKIDDITPLLELPNLR